MTDPFALLNQPRRPWLDPDVLKHRFLELSSGAHPDRAHALSQSDRDAAHDRYVQLNAAYQSLRDPRSRIRCLLDLERGNAHKPIHDIPPDLMNLSLEVGQACRETDILLRTAAATTSPILKVELFERTQSQQEKLQDVHGKIGSRREETLGEVRDLDSSWGPELEPTDRRTRLDRLEELYSLLSYFDRWLKQIHDRIVALSVPS